MYPYLRPLDTSDLIDYELDTGLFYLHAAESVSPSLSIESVSSKIVANLISPSFKPENHNSMHDSEDLWQNIQNQTMLFVLSAYWDLKD